MDQAFVELFVIAFVGAILFLLVDKHEGDGPIARLLKFLVLFGHARRRSVKRQPMQSAG